MKNVCLPETFKPVDDYELLRIGSDYDGGYLVEGQSLQNSDILLSFGIDNDWKFEQHFYALKPIRILAYDGTVGWQEFLKTFAKSIFALE